VDGVFVLALPRPIARSVGVALIAALRHAPLLRGSANRINIPALKWCTAVVLGSVEVDEGRKVCEAGGNRTWGST
jgi:hypothetical protein